ncbi:MAG: Inorganic pyrophosphatase [Chlamydiales bacterium]|nr:Inorganic pyrophosphatase [Chlamydiales bacterium]MCH9635401.1 Inorganic pyrophosphatase [Chlamydiales bacterium]MCH9704299.1 inorganic pyrophosphatase [Chlamydiota bacterium]
MTQESYLEYLNLFSRAHPWHGVHIGHNCPEEVQCYIEIVPTDTVKFELDKNSGLLMIDRPQKYSNNCPCLYGLIPQTYAARRVGEYCSQKSGRENVYGDEDPLDICILTEKPILRGDILVTAIPIGGIRAIDGEEADDKIIAVLKGDLVYKNIRDIKDCPDNLIDRLVHYFMTYKESPEDLRGRERRLEIDSIYGRDEALEVIGLAQQDYDDHFPHVRAQLDRMHQKPSE